MISALHVTSPTSQMQIPGGADLYSLRKAATIALHHINLHRRPTPFGHPSSTESGAEVGFYPEVSLPVFGGDDAHRVGLL